MKILSTNPAITSYERFYLHLVVKWRITYFIFVFLLYFISIKTSTDCKKEKQQQQKKTPKQQTKQNKKYISSKINICFGANSAGRLVF